MLSVEDVLVAVPASRRSLERRFRKHLARGIHDEIQRAHTARARRLLAEMDLRMGVVARRAGFPGTKRFDAVFREQTGQTPTAFRVAFRVTEYPSPSSTARAPR